MADKPKIGWFLSEALIMPIMMVAGIIGVAGVIIWLKYFPPTLETKYAYYPTFMDAEKDGAVKRGWIPSFVPRDATVIHELHNIDTNEQWMSFSAYPNSLAKMVSKLAKDEPCLRSGSDIARRWSKQIAIYDPIGERQIYPMYVFIGVRTGSVVKGHVVVDRYRNRVYYWAP